MSFFMAGCPGRLKGWRGDRSEQASEYSVFLPGEALVLVSRQEFRCPLRASLASKTLQQILQALEEPTESETQWGALAGTLYYQTRRPVQRLWMLIEMIRSHEVFLGS